MDKGMIEEQVIDLLADICDDDAVREERDIDLFDAGLLDSLAGIEVLVAIEEAFGVQIAPTEVERGDMNTVNKTPISVLTPEQYRLAEVAQLFVQQPRVILLDEPSRCLSAESATSVLTCISKWVRDTRNIAVVAAEGVIPAANVDRILTLERGKLMNA